MGGADDVGELPVGVFGGVCAFGVPEGVPEVGFPPDVQGGSGDSSFLEGGVEGLLLDDGGSGDVHDEGGGLHEAYLVFADHASGLRGEGDGDHQEVRLHHYVVQVAPAPQIFEPEGFFQFGVGAAPDCENLHLEGLEAFGDLDADAAHAYYARFFMFEGDSGGAASACFECVVSGYHVFG